MQCTPCNALVVHSVGAKLLAYLYHENIPIRDFVHTSTTMFRLGKSAGEMQADQHTHIYMRYDAG